MGATSRSRYRLLSCAGPGVVCSLGCLRQTHPHPPARQAGRRIPRRPRARGRRRQVHRLGHHPRPFLHRLLQRRRQSMEHPLPQAPLRPRPRPVPLVRLVPHILPGPLQDRRRRRWRPHVPLHPRPGRHQTDPHRNDDPIGHQVVLHPHRTIGSVKGSRYAETGMFRTKLHLHEDPAQPLLATQEVLGTGIERPVALKRRKTETVGDVEKRLHEQATFWRVVPARCLPAGQERVPTR